MFYLILRQKTRTIFNSKHSLHLNDTKKLNVILFRKNLLNPTSDIFIRCAKEQVRTARPRINRGQSFPVVLFCNNRLMSREQTTTIHLFHFIVPLHPIITIIRIRLAS